MDRNAAIILSMTAEERKAFRAQRITAAQIAAGCGMKVEDVNRLIKQFEQMQKMMKQFGGKGKAKRKNA